MPLFECNIKFYKLVCIGLLPVVKYYILWYLPKSKLLSFKHIILFKLEVSEGVQEILIEIPWNWSGSLTHSWSYTVNMKYNLAREDCFHFFLP